MDYRVQNWQKIISDSIKHASPTVLLDFPETVVLIGCWWQVTDLRFKNQKLPRRKSRVHTPSCTYSNSELCIVVYAHGLDLRSLDAILHNQPNRAGCNWYLVPISNSVIRVCTTKRIQLHRTIFATQRSRTQHNSTRGTFPSDCLSSPHICHY